MISVTDKERREILGAVLANELKIIREYLLDIPSVKNSLKTLGQKVEEIGEQIDEHSSILHEHSKILYEHSRILHEQSSQLDWIQQKMQVRDDVLNAHAKIIRSNTQDIKSLKKRLA